MLLSEDASLDSPVASPSGGGAADCGVEHGRSAAPVHCRGCLVAVLGLLSIFLGTRRYVRDQLKRSTTAGITRPGVHCFSLPGYISVSLVCDLLKLLAGVNVHVKVQLG